MTRWNPFKELEDLQSRFTSLIGQSPTRWNGGDEKALAVAQWAPLVDITEDDREYLIKAELPEVRKEDVRVTVENGTLSISAEAVAMATREHRSGPQVLDSWRTLVQKIGLNAAVRREGSGLSLVVNQPEFNDLTPFRGAPFSRV